MIENGMLLTYKNTISITTHYILHTVTTFITHFYTMVWLILTSDWLQGDINF